MSDPTSGPAYRQRLLDTIQSLQANGVALRAEVAALKAEVERLTVYNFGQAEALKAANARALAAESRAARLEERLGVARGVLKSVEWGPSTGLKNGGTIYTAWVCPVCLGEKDPPNDYGLRKSDRVAGHSPGCALLAALGEGE